MSDELTWVAEGRKKPRVVVLAAVNRPRVRVELGRIEKFLHLLRQRSMAVDVDETFDFSKASVDLVVVLGGDGSILSAPLAAWGSNQRASHWRDLGRLGFLAAIKEHQMAEIWPDICAGHCSIDSHVMLKCSVWRDGHQVQLQNGSYHVLALNEAAVLSGPTYSMLQIDLYVDRELVLLTVVMGCANHQYSGWFDGA